MRYPATAATLKGKAVVAPTTLKVEVWIASYKFVVMTVCSYGFVIVLTTASAVTTTLVPVLSNVNVSSGWKPLPPADIFIIVTWSAEVEETFAVAPYPINSGKSSCNILPSAEVSLK